MRGQQEKQAHEHGEVGTRIAHHKPESLARSRQLGNLRSSNGCQNDDQEGNRGDPSEKSEEHQQSANNFKCADKMRGKRRMRKTNSRKPLDSHVRIDELENALTEEDKSDGEPDQNHPADSIRAVVQGHRDLSLCHSRGFVLAAAKVVDQVLGGTQSKS